MLRITFFIFSMIVFTGCTTPGDLEKFKEAMLGKTDNSFPLTAASFPEKVTGKVTLTILSRQEEALVIEAANGKTSVSTKMGDATFEFEENGFTIVSYAIKKDKRVTNIKCIVRNNEVVALTKQSKLSSIDPFAFSYAAEIAQQKHNSTLEGIPVLYKWHAFIPEVFDDCTILVREKDPNVEYFVYRTDVCK